MSYFKANLAIVVLCVIIHVSFGLVPRNSRKTLRQHNEHCILYDSSSSCNSSQGLMCLDSGLKGYRCLCPSNKLHAQLYDSKRNACVGKVLNACVRGSHSRQVNESLCVEHAECNTAAYGIPICMCKAGYTENDNGGCVESLRYGEACDSEVATTTASSSEEDRDGRSVQSRSGMERKCDEKSGLSCIDSKCQCRYAGDQYYDEMEGKCISFAGGRCSHENHVYSCVRGAKCPAPLLHIKIHTHPLGLPLPPLRPPFITEIAAGERGDEDGDIFVMSFKPPHLPGPPPPPPPHRLPPIHFHQSYKPPYPPHMEAKSDPGMEFDSMRFDDYGRSIFFGNGKGEKNGAEPRCECLPGFSRTAAGWCMKSYGNKCSPEDEDSIGNSTGGSNSTTRVRELCNADQFLECMDAQDASGSFTCQCRNLMNERYDPERRECVALIGRRCRPMGNYPKCEKGSECVNGICECGNGTSLTPMGTCAKDYGEQCMPGDCNSWKGLMCHGKSRTCLCLDSYLRYDEGRRACTSSLGSTCGTVRSGISTSESTYIECDQGLDCVEKQIGGRKMASRCEAKSS